MTHTTEIVLAALLHDIGKVLERAGQLSPNIANVPGLPAGENLPVHVRHSLALTHRLAASLLSRTDSRCIARLVASHHAPRQPDEWIIAEADRLAGGGDSSEADGAPALQSILSQLRLHDCQPADEMPEYSPAEMNLDDVSATGPGATAAGYACLANAIGAWVGANHPCDLSDDLVVQAVSGMSERFLSRVPTGLRQRCVPLHDHGVVASAIAGTMFRFHDLQGIISEAVVRDEQTAKFRMVVGSLRGIQDFLFDRPVDGPKGLAKTYRAKSFYVTAVTEAVVARLLGAARLPRVCCLLSGGGRFQILADATDVTWSALKDEVRNIQTWFVNAHLGMLSLAVSTDLILNAADLQPGAFADTCRRIEAQAEAAKARPLANVLQDADRWKESSFLLKDKACDQIQQDHHDQAVKLGGGLPKARWMGLWRMGVQPDDAIDCCGLRLRIGDHYTPELTKALSVAWVDVDRPPDQPWLPWRPVANHVPLLTRPDVQCLQVGTDKVTNEDQLPQIGGPATFEHLGALSRRKVRRDDKDVLLGRPMLACLRADMDRLGALLARGQGSRGSLAGGSAVSRMIDLFFKGHVTRRMERPDSPYRLVYTVFAGGDDLMLIGPWWMMFRFAADLREWLDQLTAKNPDVTLSASLALGQPKTPVNEMARIAGEWLDRAKTEGRNRVSVFRRVLAWDAFRRGLDISNRLSRWIDEQVVHGGLVYRFLRHALAAERIARQINCGQPVCLEEALWRSHLLYDIRRNLDTGWQGKDCDARRQAAEYLRSLLPPSEHDLQTASSVVIGAMCALCQNRGQ